MHEPTQLTIEGEEEPRTGLALTRETAACRPLPAPRLFDAPKTIRGQLAMPDVCSPLDVSGSVDGQLFDEREGPR